MRAADAVHQRDFYEFHIASRSWTDLSSDSAPSIRAVCGVAVADGKVYVFAGRFALDSECSLCPSSRTRRRAGLSLLAVSLVGVVCESVGGSTSVSQPHRGTNAEPQVLWHLSERWC